MLSNYDMLDDGEEEIRRVIDELREYSKSSSSPLQAKIRGGEDLEVREFIESLRERHKYRAPQPLDFGKYFFEILGLIFRDTLKQIGETERFSVRMGRILERPFVFEIENSISPIENIENIEDVGSLGSFFGRFTSKIKRAVKKMGSYAKRGYKRAVRALKRAASYAKRGLRTASSKLIRKAYSIASKVKVAAYRYGKRALNFGKRVVRKTYNVVKSAPKKIYNVVKNVPKRVYSAVKRVGGWVKNVGNKIITKASDFMGMLKDKVMKVGSYIKDKLTSLYQTKIAPLFNKLTDYMNRINIRLALINQKKDKVTNPLLREKIREANLRYKREILPKYQWIQGKVNAIKRFIEKILGIGEYSEKDTDEGIGIGPLGIAAGVVAAMVTVIVSLKLYLSYLENLNKQINVDLPATISDKGLQEANRLEQSALNLEMLASKTTDPNIKQNYLSQAQALRQQAAEIRTRSLTPSALAPSPPKKESIIKRLFGIDIDIKWIVIAAVILLLLPYILPKAKTLVQYLPRPGGSK